MLCSVFEPFPQTDLDSARNGTGMGWAGVGVVGTTVIRELEV